MECDVIIFVCDLRQQQIENLRLLYVIQLMSLGANLLLIIMEGYHFSSGKSTDDHECHENAKYGKILFT